VLKKILSGGQSGVDRAALDAAMDMGLEAGGWCPRGRRSEDGILDSRYPLQETPSRDYEQRTEWNVRDSDGTLVLTTGRPEGGSARTIEAASHQGKPFFVVNLLGRGDVKAVLFWMEFENIQTLNVAGPRESKVPGIKQMAMAFVKDLVVAVRERQKP
jgi:hypothetical protein